MSNKMALDALTAAKTQLEILLPDYGRVHEETEALAKIDAAIAAALQAEPQPAKAFQGYLCRAWGETDLPCAEVVRDLAGVSDFMVREWLGDKDDTDYDGTPTLPRVLAEIEAQDWSDDHWHIEFEIGGVSVEKVYSFAALPTPPKD